MMVTRLSTMIVLALALTASVPAAEQGQPPRSPSSSAADQSDADFALRVKEWTTKPEFLSPLIDHLPKKAGVPTPKDILGYHIGTPKKLTYTADQQRYLRALEKALPSRVKTVVVGKSEEGRDILIAFISSE